MTTPTFHLLITPGTPGEPPTVLARATEASHNVCVATALQGDTDTALVARAMLQAGAYLFTQGQPVRFGAEIPLGVLK